MDVTDEATPVYGRAGSVPDRPVERYYRDARLTRTYGGTGERQENSAADGSL